MTETPPSTAATPSPPVRRRWGLLISGLFIFLGLATAAGLYDLKRDIKNLERRTRESLHTLTGELQNLQQLKEAQLTANQQRDAMLASVATLQSRADQADANYAQVAGMVQGGRRLWQLAEVEQLLLIANDRLLLHHDTGGALRALELADARLAPIANTQPLMTLRQRLTADISAVKAVPKLDMQGLTLRLNSLIERAPGLPQTSQVPGNFNKVTADAEAPQEVDGWRRFLESALRALRGLVEVRRRDQPIAPLLPPDQEFFLYQNLQLKLETARLALLQRDTAAYQSALKLASAWIQAFFAPEHPSVQAVLQELQELERQELNWPLPDLSKTLEQLRELAARLATQSAPAGAGTTSVPSP